MEKMMEDVQAIQSGTKVLIAMANVPSNLESWLSVEMAEDALDRCFVVPFASVRSCEGVAAVFRHLELAMLLIFR